MICRSGLSNDCLSVRPAADSMLTVPVAAIVRGQIGQSDHAFLAQQHGSLDHVLQLADVARAR